jgi:uncharacterized repeat protein (TIGR03803 family)
MKYVLMASVAGLLAGTAAAQAQSYTESVLYSFKGGTADGSGPQSVLIQDAQGNLYGTTVSGGKFGFGTVFKVTPSGTETVLHAFAGGTDGASPQGGLVGDASGNLYGTTNKGGSDGFGTIYEISSTGVETVLHTFAGGTDGEFPNGTLARDGVGNLYGTTTAGGTGNYGTVFELPAKAAETILHAFTGKKDGAEPQGGVIYSAGTLYGTSSVGTKSPDGQVFGLGVNGTYGTLVTFNGANGQLPSAGLLQDSSGNLYGDTEAGGTDGAGVVFKVNSARKEKVLYSFTGGTDGKTPDSTLIENAKGVVYGTTINGGAASFGVVFAVTPDGSESVVHAFTGGKTDGAYPQAGLESDPSGNLYGTTVSGGAGGAGTVFKLTYKK